MNSVEISNNVGIESDNKITADSVNKNTCLNDIDKNSTTAINHDFEIVSRGKRKNVVIGSKSSKDLDVVIPKKWLHLSSFKPTVSADDIIKYVTKHSGITKDSLACYNLLKKDAQIDSLKKINFKIGVTSDLYDKLLCPDLWPNDVKVRPFRFRQLNNNNV